MTDNDIPVPSYEKLEVVNRISVSMLDAHAGTNTRDRVGVYLGMADQAFAQLVEAGGDPDTVSMSAQKATVTESGEDVVVITFGALRLLEGEDGE